MKSRLLLIAMIIAMPSFAMAVDNTGNASDLTDKVMKDNPGTKGGSTADPTAKPTDSSISTKVMKDEPGTKGGTTADPTAKPDDGSLSTKVMKDAPGTK